VSQPNGRKETKMKRIAIVVAFAASVVAVPAVLAADAGDGKGGDNPYADAHLVPSPLGTLYGPVRAGPPSSTSYGYVTR
jgi:hypothetical protein